MLIMNSLLMEVSKRKTLWLLRRAANGNICAKTVFFIESNGQNQKRDNSDDIIALNVHSLDMRCTSMS